MKSILTAIFILLIISCSKNDSPAPPVKPTSCRIATATYHGPAYTFTYTLTYNDSGKIIKLLYDGPTAYVKTFKYSGNMIYMSLNAAGSNQATDTVSLNGFGKIATHKEITSQSVYNTSFLYDAGGQVISSTTQQDNNPAVTTNYYFTDGDLTNTSSAASKDTIVYNPGKPVVIGNLDDFNQLIYYGSSYFTNKHLKQLYLSWPSHYDFTYSYDADGKIVNVESNDGSVSESFSFTYECK
jgi:hypothetical protein